jgi:regulation of enolase protein 1 (concanavalin A-like superfamily)
MLGTAEMQAATLTLSWDRNPEPDIAGYIISYGTSSGSYTTSVDVGNVTTWTISLSSGFRYFFAAQAYDTAGLRSPMSSEVSADLSQTSAPSITSLSPSSGSIGTVVIINGANFGSSQGTSTVTFNGTAAAPTSWSANAIGVPAPSGATTGPIVVNVNDVASNGATFAVVTSSLPAPWLSQDIGSPSVAGQASYSAGMFTVLGAGSDIWGITDQFRFVYQPLDGDGEIVARVATVENKDAWTKAAVMIRGDLTANAAYAMAALTSLNGTVFQSRSTAGGPSTFVMGTTAGAPQWIRVVRSGNTLSGYSSADGSTWTATGMSTITTGSTVYVGLAVTSHNPSVTATATFTNVAVTGSPWLSQDIGSPGIAGQASYSAGTFTVLGAGSDIWGITDQFHFVYQPLDGDGEIVARVATVEGKDAWTKAAVMIRSDLTANAAYAMAAVTSLNGTVFQSRSTAGGASTFVTGTTAGAPQWIRVVRSGNTLSGYSSADGLTWAAIGTSTITAGSTVYVGLAVTSHDPSTVATATFTNVAVTKGATTN